MPLTRLTFKASLTVPCLPAITGNTQCRTRHTAFGQSKIIVWLRRARKNIMKTCWQLLRRLAMKVICLTLTPS
ncbi:putative transcription activator [Burkholderia pseudomallei MSHR2138]|nr:putative transcription activator [Burkholderia pseudomallei MSHR2138]